MTVSNLVSKLGLEPLCLSDGEREISGVYCCDLLSVVMSKAFSDCAWVTIMGNINAVAVATLADMSCVILAEGTALDDAILAKAKQQGVNLLKSDKPIFETALAIYNACENA